MAYHNKKSAIFSALVTIGSIIMVSHGAGATPYDTKYEYDDLRRPVKIIAPDNSYTKNTYNDQGLVSYVEKYTAGNVLFQKSRIDYTPTGKVEKTYGPQCFTYPTGANDFSAADCAITTNYHDPLDRVKVTKDGEGHKTKTIYFPDGLPNKIIRAWQGNPAAVSELLSDADPCIISSTSQQCYATYTYTDNGNEASVVDANGNKTEYFYDGHDRLDKFQLPSKTVTGQSNAADYEQYEYDANGNLTGKRTRKGDWILTSFDALNRAKRKILQTGGGYSAISVTCASATGETCYSYDKTGRETEVKYADSSHTVTNIYDGAGRLWKTTDDGRLIEYDYDDAGNRTMVKWPDGYYAIYNYDALNRVTTIKENGSATLATYAYTNGRRSTLTLGNGAVTSYTYHANDLLNTLGQNMTGTGDDITWDYGFNKNNQMSEISASNADYVWVTGANKTDTYVPNGLNQYTTIASVSITYDYAGNLTGDGTWTYGYDIENMLITASKSGTSASYTYDPMGRRSAKTVNSATTTFLNDGVEEIADYDGSTLLRRYVHGPGVDEYLVMYTGSGTGTKSYFHSNHQGSIVAMSDGSGDMEDQFTYDSYGNVNDATGVPFKYTGRRLDEETGLYYYRARYYSPEIGRFMQTDPIGYGDGLNWYSYVDNDPMNATDPSGEWVWILAGAAINVVIESYAIAQEGDGFSLSDAGRLAIAAGTGAIGVSRGTAAAKGVLNVAKKIGLSKTSSTTATVASHVGSGAVGGATATSIAETGIQTNQGISDQGSFDAGEIFDAAKVGAVTGGMVGIVNGGVASQVNKTIPSSSSATAIGLAGRPNNAVTGISEAANGIVGAIDDARDNKEEHY